MSETAELNIAALVSEGAVLAAELAGFKEKNERLEEIKATLRNLAGGLNTTFSGENGETAEITHPRDSIARYMRGDLLKRVLALAGRRKWFFFQLSPIPAKELPSGDLRVEILQRMPKHEANKLLAALNVPSTPRVKFA